ncbi:MAG TPA: hypothetical protein VLL08_25370 [Kineosporiaceae bacterium]|nr:hypothetical protein [Kineosporiaceae bacterium]
MIFPAVMVIGALAATFLIIATVIVVQQDKQANRRRAQRADQILGALYGSSASELPWRSIYQKPPERISTEAQPGSVTSGAT